MRLAAELMMMKAKLIPLRLNELLDFAFDLWEIFVNVFPIQEANKDSCVILKSNADPIIPNSQTKMIPATFELLQIRHIH